MIHFTITRLTSLLKQTACVGIGFLIMLLITSGHPSSFIVRLSVVLGICFVVWSENKKGLK